MKSGATDVSNSGAYRLKQVIIVNAITYSRTCHKIRYSCVVDNACELTGQDMCDESVI
ncbi:hypothetical protein [Vibrio splendidus]|uniref:hypothetical protein n=1 Tax=Vibrio splendidus TaxID=29497 RepID=UPI0012FFE27E